METRDFRVTAVRSDEVYRKIAMSPAVKRDDIYRYELMKPFEKKWACYHVPLKAKEKNGYDVIMAGNMLGFQAPGKIDESWLPDIDLLSRDKFWGDCRASIERSLLCFTENGVNLPVTEYSFTLLLADPDSPYTKISSGYCGDGGIPGYIFGWLKPSEYTMGNMPAALAHETNHNVRFQYIKWHDDITLGEMMISEGLADNFASSLYGEESLGPWATGTDMETLNDYIKPIIRDGLDVQGMDNLTAYLYGDEMAAMQNYFPVGLPYCAGYACGYHLVKYYLEKSGRSVTEATLIPAEEILREAEGFWE